jgi:hypothetical protein
MLNITQLHLLLRSHLMQHPFKYQYSADHHMHLIPAPNGYGCNVTLHMSFHPIFQKEINRFFNSCPPTNCVMVSVLPFKLLVSTYQTTHHHHHPTRAQCSYWPCETLSVHTFCYTWISCTVSESLVNSRSIPTNLTGCGTPQPFQTNTETLTSNMPQEQKHSPKFISHNHPPIWQSTPYTVQT